MSKFLLGKPSAAFSRFFLSHFAFLAALLLLFAPQAHAQTSLLDALNGPETSITVLNSSNPVLSRSFTTDASATVTSVVVRIADSGLQNTGTPSFNANLTVDGNAFSFSSYQSNYLTTFTGNAVLAANTTYEIRFECLDGCPSSVVLYPHSSPSTGWPFATAEKFQVQLLGELNADPVLSNIGNQSHRENEASVSVTTGATDANSGDTLTYSASGLPTGLSINTGTGAITGTPTAAGTYNATVSVSDGNGGSDSESFTWTISANNAPVLSSIGNQSGTIGSAISITPMASDADSDSVTWSASSLPSGLSINQTTGAISGTPDTNQSLSTTVSIDDGYGGTDSETFSFTIANTAPVLAMIGDQASTVGTAVSVTPSASDTNGDTISWSASNLPSGLSIDTNSGAITGTPDTAGSSSSTISISDGNGGSDSETLTWTVVVGNSAPVITPIADRDATIDEALTFSPDVNDANGDTLSYAATGLPTGLSINETSGEISGTPTAIGVYNVTITATDPDNESDTASFDWTISAAPVAQASEETEDAMPSSPTEDAVTTPMLDNNAMELFDITRQSIVPAIRMATKIGLSRLAELRDNSSEGRSNGSSHQIQLAFNDKGLQQMADSGFTDLANDLANLTSDFVLPEGMAAWSRTQSIMGSLKTASTGQSVDIDGNNITFGLDYRYTPELTLGWFYQRANSESKSMSQNALTDLNSGLFMIYGSYVVKPDVYVQGGVGTGRLEFDIDRTVNGDDYSASRNGDKMHWMLAASQRFRFESFDMTLTLDTAYQSIALDPYRESMGMATYQYLKQEMRTYYIGGNLSFSDSFTNELGEVSLSGEIGFQADMSDDTVARAFLLADPSTIYEYRLDADDDEQSLSHSSLVLGASLLTENNWLFNASADFFVYQSGTLTGLTLSASKAF